MIGVIILCALIIFVAISVSGWGVVIIPVVGCAIYFAILIMVDHIAWKRKRNESPNIERVLTEKERLEREKAIDEWERKWQRKHPTRI